MTGFAQDDTGVDVELADGESLRAQYLVGCDGGRSVIRKAAGIEFPGWDATRSNLIAEVEMTEEPELGVRHDALGIHGIGRLEYEIRDGEVVYKDEGPVRVMVTEQQLGPSGEPTLRDLSEALIAVYGTDFGIHSPTWISRFTDMTRQAAAYRAGRVLLAGDSAHVHYPAGGQGLSLGVQDAVNLGWKLAQVVNGTSPESLLDTYHDERHPVAARALRHTMAQTALQRQDERMKALVDVVSELASMDEPRKRLAGIISGLDIHYDLGEGHPLLGRRMPDLDLVSADGPLRVFELLHDAKPVLLNLGEPGGFDIAPWADRVQLIDAEYVGLWELPVLGAVTAPTAVLIRPDGYVAWVGDGTTTGLRDALTTWFGPRCGAVVEATAASSHPSTGNVLTRQCDQRLGGDPDGGLSAGAGVADAAVGGAQAFQVADRRATATATYRAGVIAGGDQALDRPGGGLGVGFASVLLWKAAVEVLRADQITRRRAQHAPVVSTRVGERLQRRAGVIDVAGRAVSAEGEAAVGVLLALDPARRFADRARSSGE